MGSKNINLIRRINKTIVHEDGSFDSFDKQLIKLMSGIYDTTYPLVIAENTNSLQYIDDFHISNPLIMNPSTVIKLREKHELGYAFVSNCETYLKESVLAFDSYQHDSSKIILLNEHDEDGFPMIAICRENKSLGLSLLVNEITSIYDKEHLEKMLVKSFEQDCKFYKTKKIEQYVESTRLQLPQGIAYALSTKYFRSSFTKSQVLQDLSISKKTTLTQRLEKAKVQTLSIKKVSKEKEYSK